MTTDTAGRSGACRVASSLGRADSVEPIFAVRVRVASEVPHSIWCQKLYGGEGPAGKVRVVLISRDEEICWLDTGDGGEVNDSAALLEIL